MKFFNTQHPPRRPVDPDPGVFAVKGMITGIGLFSRSLLQSPARLTVFGFAVFIAAGTSLLLLPAATTGGPIGFVDALFTATSAVCVTGLTVVDTGSTFSAFGHVILLFLIQTGGLGIMTLSTLFLLLAGGRPGLAGQVVILDTFSPGRERSIPGIIRDVVLFTLVIEALGMVLMFLCFVREKGVAEAVSLSVFHSVSAFCNAGFSLFPDSFVTYREDMPLNLILCLLIVVGGTGFPVLSEIKGRFSRKRRRGSRLSLHSKMVLATTGILLVSGTLLAALMEWHNTLASLSSPDRVLSAFFQNVNARTSGFNTLPVGAMADGTLFVLILLMFVGASPGSCGGGVKTTTLAILAALGMSRLGGKDRPQLFRRTISEESVGRAINVMMVSAVVVCAGILVLLMTESTGIGHPRSRGMFLELVFEVVSAFGTVGLSTGLTGGLSAGGKIMISAIMFMGRLGPLMVIMAASPSRTCRYHYAEETVMVG